VNVKGFNPEQKEQSNKNKEESDPNQSESVDITNDMNIVSITDQNEVDVNKEKTNDHDMQNKLQNDKNKILQDININNKVNENKDNLHQDSSVDDQSDNAEQEEDINIDKQSFLNYINKVKPDSDSIEQMLEFNTASRYLPNFKTSKRLSMRKVIQWIASD